MASLKMRCPRCQSTCDALVHQRLSNGKPAWSVATVCRACPYREESDGLGLPPADLRRHLLEQEGAYELVLEGYANTGQVLRGIQKALSLPIDMVASLKKKLPGPVLSGTKFEMDWLASILHSEGGIMSVRPMLGSQHHTSFDLAEILPAGWPNPGKEIGEQLGGRT
jgi:hypothetical protein